MDEETRPAKQQKQQQGEKPYLSAELVTEKRQRSENQISAVSDVSPLVERMKSKSVDRTCPQCHKTNNNNKIYCYDCLIPVGNSEENELPHVDLPIKLDILRHPKELRTKSTALHAQVICGSDMVRTVELPEVEKLTGIDPQKTLLLFPTHDAKAPAEIPDLASIERVVVVDSTWQQANMVLRSDLCQSLTRHVKLAENHQTSFWRHQKKGDDHLATIEAIYYFFRERYEALNGEYDGRYDNMLYIFGGMLRLIESAKKESAATSAEKTDDGEAASKSEAA